MTVSVLILTLNEEINIKACIDSVLWSDDIWVLDSFSSDGTQEIAAALGARIIKRKFDDWSSHQNWALQNIKFKHSWVFYIDADERCPEALASEIKVAVKKTPGISAFRIKRKDIFRGKWLKHAQLYPTWLVRLFKPERVRFARLVNPKPLVDGEIAELKTDIVHYPFSHGISHWIARHNKYSDMEAIESVKLRDANNMNISDLFSRNPNNRRIAQKNLFYRFPARPVVKFLYYYFIRRGFLDGSAGLNYCLLQSFYEFMITLKTSELTKSD